MTDDKDISSQFPLSAGRPL